MYINIFDYKDNNFPIQIFIGGRGTGKTYSALSNCINNDIRFILMRRTAQELDIMLDSDKGEGANPFKPINRDFGTNVGLRQIRRNIAGIYNREVDNDKLIHKGLPIGYGVALSTISSIRGVDFSDCTDLVYDEFIAEKHVRKMKEEGSAFLNAIETIARNRELDGREPLRVWLLANSNDIYNPIFIELGIVSDVERMVRRGQEHLYYKERGLAIHMITDNNDFVEKKRETSLYKLTEGTTYYEMALNNDFAYNDFSLIGYKKLKGYRPICTIDEATIYYKKGTREFYVTYAKAKCETYTAKHEQDRRLFMQKFGFMLEDAFTDGMITFESYQLKAFLLDIIL